MRRDAVSLATAVSGGCSPPALPSLSTYFLHLSADLRRRPLLYFASSRLSQPVLSNFHQFLVPVFDPRTSLWARNHSPSSWGRESFQVPKPARKAHTNANRS